jgi:hypothetical protein
MFIAIDIILQKGLHFSVKKKLRSWVLADARAESGAGAKTS